MSTVRAFGLNVSSPWPLPGAVAVEAAPDIVLAEGHAALSTSSQPAKRVGPYRCFNGELLLDWPRIGHLHFAAEGTGITAELLAGVDEVELSARLIATALPAALWQRGDFVLHAGCAVLPGTDRAIAFAGASGAGKSALLKRVLEAGGKLVAEDATRLVVSDSGVMVSGLPGCLHLRRQGRPLQEPRVTAHVPPEQQLDSAPLGAIVVLQPAASGASHERLSQVKAVASLLSHKHRPSVPQVLGELPRVLLQAARIAGSVPVYFRQGQNTQLWIDGDLAWLRLLAESI